MADANVRHTVVHVPVRGRYRQRPMDQVNQTEVIRRHVHVESVATSHRLHGPRGRAHGRRRHALGPRVRHAHGVRR